MRDCLKVEKKMAKRRKFPNSYRNLWSAFIDVVQKFSDSSLLQKTVATILMNDICSLLAVFIKEAELSRLNVRTLSLTKGFKHT
jgi:hypothetical protein